MTSAEARFTVCCLAKAVELQRLHAAQAVYSFLNPDIPAQRLLRFDDTIRHRTYLMFDQERGRFEDQVTQATSRFIAEIIERPPHSGNNHTIIHCHGGVSRSTAACYIAMALAWGSGHEAQAFDKLLQITNKPWPNLRMVEHADELLQRNGKLIAPLRGYRARNPNRLAAYRRLNSTRGFLSSVIRDETLGQE